MVTIVFVFQGVIGARGSPGARGGKGEKVIHLADGFVVNLICDLLYIFLMFLVSYVIFSCRV